MFGTKEEMKKHAEGRITDLKSRGFENAGLYDPPGVGGTHVMYVLHHADKPRDLCRPAEGSADQPDRRALEGGDQICRPRRDGRFAAIGFLHYLVDRAEPGHAARTRKTPSS